MYVPRNRYYFGQDMILILIRSEVVFCQRNTFEFWGNNPIDWYDLMFSFWFLGFSRAFAGIIIPSGRDEGAPDS